MKAMEVFSICIKHLKDGLLEEINKKLTSDIMISDIDFVITVPAIWGDAAKMFMREAAVKVSLFIFRFIIQVLMHKSVQSVNITQCDR